MYRQIQMKNDKRTNKDLQLKQNTERQRLGKPCPFLSVPPPLVNLFSHSVL